MIPRRVIAIYTPPGENSAKSNPECVRARARACGRVCVCGGNCEQTVNKM